MREFMDILKALADESRVRVLMALKDRELCVCQVTALLELAPSTVSKHMAILRQARLVEGRKDGRWTHYRRAEEGRGSHIPETLSWLDECLGEEAAVVSDRERLEVILATAPEEICRRQSRSA